MAPPRKRVRTSPSATTATASPGVSSPQKPSSQPSAASPPPFQLSDPWTPAQETALLKLLVYHKPTGMHKHFNMVQIYTSLQSQGLTHTRPLPSEPEVLIEHMMPEGIWEKLRSLYDLDVLDEREEAWQLDNEFRGKEDELSDRETPPSQRDKFAFLQEFSLDSTGGKVRDPADAEDFRRMMFARRLKTEGDTPSSPGLEERSVGTPEVRGSKRGPVGRGRSMRQSTVGARRGSRATTTTTSTIGDEGEEEEDGGKEKEKEQRPSRSTRGSTRETSRKTKGKKK